MRAKLLRGSIWISAARICSNILSLIATVVLARILVPDDFGIVALASSILAIVTSITDVPMTDALIQHRSPSRMHIDTVWTFNVLRGVLVALTLGAVSFPIGWAYGDPRLGPVLLVISVGVIVTSLGNPQSAMMTRDLVFWQQFIFQVSQRAVALVVSVAVAISTQSFWALIVGTMAGQAVSVASSYLVRPYRPRFTLRHAREFMSFSGWLALSRIINTVNWNLDPLLVGTFLGKADLAFYSVGGNFAALPTREAITPLTSTLFPAFSNLSGSLPDLTHAYQKAQAMVTAIALPVGIGMAVVAEPLVRLVFGEKWLPVALVIQLLASTFALQTLGSLAPPLAMSVGRTRLLFTRDVQAICIRVPAIVLGLYFGGLFGLLVGRMLVSTFGIMLSMITVKQVTGLTLVQQMKPNFRAIVAAGCMGAFVFWVDSSMTHQDTIYGLILRLALDALVGAATYIGLSFLMWYFAGQPNGPEAEVRSVFRLARKKLSAAKP